MEGCWSAVSELSPLTGASSTEGCTCPSSYFKPKVP